MTTQIYDHAVTALTLRAAFAADKVKHNSRILTVEKTSPQKTDLRENVTYGR